MYLDKGREGEREGGYIDSLYTQVSKKIVNTFSRYFLAYLVTS